MTRLVLVFIELLTCNLIGYGNTIKAVSLPHQGNYIIFWNEDEVNSYKVTLKEDKFYYSISIKKGLKDSIENYEGTYSYSSDTLFLKITGKQPKGIAPYFVVEASRHYLIQYFTDGRKRMFLRIQHRISF